MMKYCA